MSRTNVQVPGVDEPDFVKNDEHYIYIVSNGVFRIIDAWPAHRTHEIAKVPLEGTPKKLFVEGDRAVVYTSGPAPSSPPSAERWGSTFGSTTSSECTYGYDCDVGSDGTTTQIHIFDLRDRAHPQQIRRIGLSGSLIAARRVENAVHTVVADPSVQVPGLVMVPPSFRRCQILTPQARATILREVAELRRTNEALVRAADLSPKLPKWRDSAWPGSAPPCSGYYASKLADGKAFTSVVSFDLRDDSPMVQSTILTKPGFVYGSGENLYMAVRHERPSGGPWFRYLGSEVSTLHQFQMGPRPSDTQYVASGTLEGRVLNSLAMDEWKGSFRVASTKGHLPSPTAENQLTVFERKGHELVPVGKLQGIAPSEDIRAVRFDEDRAYVVTFKKTDPLFVFDLSNANAPSKWGELKIPGFSTYIHRMDPTHLLTVGYDSDDRDSFAFFQGVLLQIFDVSNPRDPKLTFKERIGTRGSSSEALTNPLAFTYFAPKNVLALPLTLCEGGHGGTFGTTMTFSGLIVYDVSASRGFREKGRVPHPAVDVGEPANAACSNWWTGAKSVVRRSIFMDDYVYSVSDKLLKVNWMRDFDEALPSLSLTQ